MKKVVCLFAALSLGACMPIGLNSAPAPLAATAIDDVALRTAWQGFEVAIQTITLLRQAGVIKAGSPSALKIADGIDRVTAALNAAEHAATVGSTTDYTVALTEARAAIADLRLALKGN